jgi:hypothetical protein
MVEANNGQITPAVKAYFHWCWNNVCGFSDDPKCAGNKANDGTLNRQGASTSTGLSL